MELGMRAIIHNIPRYQDQICIITRMCQCDYNCPKPCDRTYYIVEVEGARPAICKHYLVFIED